MAITRIGQLCAETRNTSEFISEVTGAVNSATIVAVPRTGGFSYQYNSTRRPSGLAFPSTTQFWAGAWLQHRGTSDTASNIVSLFRFSAAPVYYVQYNYPTNNLETNIGVEQQVSAYTTGFMRQMVWMHLGIHFKADPVDGFFSFYIDGKQIFNYTGELTGGATNFYFGGTPEADSADGSWTQAWFDDWYIEDTTGEVDTPPPPRRFIFSLPNGAGINTEWAPTGAAANFQTVDEAPPDTDTSYVEAATVGVIDSYELADYTLPVHWDIEAVIPQVWAKDLNGDADIDLHLYDGVYGVGSTKALTTSYASYNDRFTSPPSGGSWDLTSINAIQMGYERVA